MHVDPGTLKEQTVQRVGDRLLYLNWNNCEVLFKKAQPMENEVPIFRYSLSDNRAHCYIIPHYPHTVRGTRLGLLWFPAWFNDHQQKLVLQNCCVAVHQGLNLRKLYVLTESSERYLWVEVAETNEGYRFLGLKSDLSDLLMRAEEGSRLIATLNSVSVILPWNCARDWVSSTVWLWYQSSSDDELRKWKIV